MVNFLHRVSKIHGELSISHPSFKGGPDARWPVLAQGVFTEAAHEAMKLLVAAALLVAPLEAIKAASRGIHPNLAPLFNVRTDFARTDLDKFKGVAAKLDNVTNQIVLVNEVKEVSGHSAAWAHLADRLNETGWIELHVSTPHEGFFSNDVKMYSAGLVEGPLSAERMSQFYSNFYPLLHRPRSKKSSRVQSADSSRALLNIRNLFNLHASVRPVRWPGTGAGGSILEAGALPLPADVGVEGCLQLRGAREGRQQHRHGGHVLHQLPC
eukprot:s1152_g2.t1